MQRSDDRVLRRGRAVLDAAAAAGALDGEGLTALDAGLAVAGGPEELQRLLANYYALPAGVRREIVERMAAKLAQLRGVRVATG